MLQSTETNNGASSYYGSLAGRLDPQLTENVKDDMVCERQGLVEPARDECPRTTRKSINIMVLSPFIVGLLMLFIMVSGGTLGDIASRVVSQLGSAIQVNSAVQLRGGSTAAMLPQNFDDGVPLSSCPSCVDSINGFATSNINSPDNHQGQLHWYCAPDSWEPIEGRREGKGGSWSVDDSTQSLTMVPPAKKDYWRKTYYEPQIIKDDGPFLYATLPSDKYYTVETTLDLTAVRQFDQAGILIRLGPEHWLKTGIEVVDHQPRLSCVVTNSFSDWSTQAWSNYTTVKEEDDKIVVHVYAQIRVHYRGTSFVVEANMPSHSSAVEVGGGGGPSASQWQFIRIAHMSNSDSPMSSSSAIIEEDATLQDAAPQKGTFWAGVFAASPEDQQGGHVTFTHFTIHEGSHFEHNAEGNQDT